MRLRTLLSSIRRYWRTFVGVMAAVLALGAVGLYFIPLHYVSTTQLLVSIQGSTTAAAYQNDGVVAGRISSYIPLLTSDVVSQRVVDKLGLSLSAPELAAKISAVNVPPSTALIDVAVSDESPEQARLIADTLAEEFISYTGALETPTGEDSQKVSTTVVTAASAPEPRIGGLVVLGAAIFAGGLALGCWAVWRRLPKEVRRPEPVVAESVPAPIPDEIPPTIAVPVAHSHPEDVVPPPDVAVPVESAVVEPPGVDEAFAFEPPAEPEPPPGPEPPRARHARPPLRSAPEPEPGTRLRLRLRSTPGAVGGRTLKIHSEQVEQNSLAPGPEPSDEGDLPAIDSTQPCDPGIAGLNGAPVVGPSDTVAADEPSSPVESVTGNGHYAAPLAKEWDGRRWVRPKMSS